MRLRVTALTGVFLGGVTACSPAMAPRTGDLAPEGRFALNAAVAAWSFGTGTVGAPEGRPPEERPRESTGGMELPGDGSTFDTVVAVAGMWDFGVRYGLLSWVEVGASVGFQRLGGELRFGVLDEDRGDPLSVALSGGGYYSAVGRGPWGRAGVDMSLRLGSVAPLLDVYVSHGASTHSALVDLPGDEDCPEEAPFMACGELRSTRWNETRLSAALGAGFSTGKDVAITVGVVPHVILGHAAMEGERLSRSEDVIHEAGLHLVVGLQTPGWD
ncbi:hypothetical protein [Chondromyces apiculatus]|uniref:Outer membrane protein beta-barrel domain-containing protein n=1 Tax=Chondromyces apiculatus DSM 436 TaxID=1192034 RepID=A0A017T3R3_9BACT|nr:hypothetical protein [Chondromyces apiculatus]EYF03196.1 Hypothetical protein CAP_5699 [Chondromyces apiculatus DSM 436]